MAVALRSVPAPLVCGLRRLSGLAVRQHWNQQEQRPGQHRGAAMSAAGAEGPPSAGTGVSIAFVTVPDKDVGTKIARSLVEGKLAACVNIIPGVESVYWWDGKVNTDPELLLKIKTRSALVPALTAHVKSLHPYDECEVTAVEVSGGSDSYLQWVRDSTGAAQGGAAP